VVLFDLTVSQAQCFTLPCDILTNFACRVIAYCSGATNGKPNRQRISIQAFLHAVVVVLPAGVISLPKPSAPSWDTDVPMTLIDMANRAVAPISLLLQFYAQFRDFHRQNGESGSLSLLSLGLQAFVMLLVSIRWFVRLGTPHYDRGDVDKMSLLVHLWDTLPILYAWGMLAINYAACAIGYALLFCCYTLGRQSEGVVIDGERARLLG
jgi:hypothetical protein